MSASKKPIPEFLQKIIDSESGGTTKPDLKVVRGRHNRHYQDANGTLREEPSPLQWPDPKPLPSTLLRVKPFDLALLPPSISPWVEDIADRMHCPPDYVGIPATIGPGTVIGRRIGIRPQAKTDWLEVANLWGFVIRRPGFMKSPAMNEAMKPLHRLEVEARKANEGAQKIYEAEMRVFKIKQDAAHATAKKQARGNGEHIVLQDIEEPEKPQDRRYIATDITYEKLGEILAAHPNGILAFRDELISLLKTLDYEDNVAARGFFLTAWNGTSGYTFDRIIRGHIHIEAACISLLGSTQPARIAEYIRRAISGQGDDGLIQRFSLMVWPDATPEWKNTDRYRTHKHAHPLGRRSNIWTSSLPT